MTEWTPEAIAEEEARRQTWEDAGWCPDSGLTILRCIETICDCANSWIAPDIWDIPNLYTPTERPPA